MALRSIQSRALRPIFGVKSLRKLSVSSKYLKDDDSSRNEASKKLSSLLQSIIQDDSLGKEQAKTVEPPSVKVAPKKRKIEKPKSLGSRIVESAEEIAKSLPGKKEETEAQLLHKLLYKDEPLTQTILKAASKKDSLMNILSGMPVEKPSSAPQQKRTEQSGEFSRADHVRKALGRKSSFLQQYNYDQKEKIDLFGKETLGIFDKTDALNADIAPMPTWDALRERDLQLLITQPPKNIYEQMIIWTERGMLWKFPIDNEQGMDEEKKVDFSEHVFLELHLEDWCPDKGPIRHFMELVCVGLSRNHYLTAKEKKDHIIWYRDFFTSKKDLIKELGAGEIKQPVQQQ